MDRRLGFTSLCSFHPWPTAWPAGGWSSVNRVYAQSSKLVEKYDVVSTGRVGGGGEYPLQDGFGWTNGVMRKLMALYPQFAANSTTGICATQERRATIIITY